jgi:spore maturation protein SpmB
MAALINIFKECWIDGHKVALSIFRFLVPILIVVKILEESGLIPYLAMPMRPLMDMLGLPAELCLAWLPCVFVSLYSGLAVLISLVPQLPELTVAQMTVFGLMVLIAHGLILEVRIAGQCGVAMPFQFILRLGSAIVAAWLLHLLLDGFGLLQNNAAILLAAAPTATWTGWLLELLESVAKIYVIVCAVMLLHRGLTYFRISEWLGRALGPVLRLLGISPNAVNIVIIGFTLGILYGSGLLIKESQEGALSRRDSLCSISLLGLSHSLIEDTLLLMLVGGSLWGLLVFRVLFTIAAGAALNRFYPVLEPLAFPKKKAEEDA